MNNLLTCQIFSWKVLHDQIVVSVSFLLLAVSVMLVIFCPIAQKSFDKNSVQQIH